MWTGSIALLVVMVAAPAAAQTQAIQLRVAVAPNAEDPRWKSGAKLEKHGECYRLKSARPPLSWPPAAVDVAGQGSATAPLFNPGFAMPDGSYQPNSADDGFNTIFIPMTDDGSGKSMICRGSILADGKDITSRTGLDVSARTYESIGSLGPMGVAVGAASARPVRASGSLSKLPALEAKIVTLVDQETYNPETGERGMVMAVNDALRVDGTFLVRTIGIQHAPQTAGPSGFEKCKTTVSASWVHNQIVGNNGQPTGINAMCFKTSTGRYGEATNIAAKLVPTQTSTGSASWKVESMTFKVTLYN